ncbi:hypothetical protein IW262DRAFT_1299672 [Armillaria fumosa]|nr:hypothetical protein IW262DRAFT_1299672 [Armillaria fumosa]
MICLIMIAAVVFGFRQRNEIIVVPIGTMFTFTQLRESMPGAPKSFGTLFIFFNMSSAQIVPHQGNIIDLVGLLPCLILLSISAVAMVGIYLFANPDNPSRRTLSWDELDAIDTLTQKDSLWTSSHRLEKYCLVVLVNLKRMPAISTQIVHAINGVYARSDSIQLSLPTSAAKTMWRDWGDILVGPYRRALPDEKTAPSSVLVVNHSMLNILYFIRPWEGHPATCENSSAHLSAQDLLWVISMWN